MANRGTILELARIDPIAEFTCFLYQVAQVEMGAIFLFATRIFMLSLRTCPD